MRYTATTVPAKKVTGTKRVKRLCSSSQSLAVIVDTTFEAVVVNCSMHCGIKGIFLTVYSFKLLTKLI